MENKSNWRVYAKNIVSITYKYVSRLYVSPLFDITFIYNLFFNLKETYPFSQKIYFVSFRSIRMVQIYV